VSSDLNSLPPFFSIPPHPFTLILWRSSYFYNIVILINSDSEQGPKYYL
jgi:hypothetical protein